MFGKKISLEWSFLMKLGYMGSNGFFLQKFGIFRVFVFPTRDSFFQMPGFLTPRFGILYSEIFYPAIRYFLDSYFLKTVFNSLYVTCFRKLCNKFWRPAKSGLSNNLVLKLVLKTIIITSQNSIPKLNHQFLFKIIFRTTSGVAFSLSV